ncbi:MAG: diaminopimelate decarboxylase [Planctomycetaceae bacterium]|jgi:diaminopimelate decarboxylase|nr:diaminopimelate decarboxylase [Planctomycetaceae bacterium]MBT6156189.1 diaminopimelate decarboxylase [Planctomycetaceae bacterium]MBT6487152.1 diaminopimelate decarboxylase [Planctomycetaceae bacterium]MBT6496120.1 diaminopimelate decarboxylase [Planctomycetaceae bacterium]
MVEKSLPFDEAKIREIAREFPTPFHIYDERGIRENARRLIAAFGWCDRFREHFAIKATPNPHLLSILNEEGFGGDCSSMAELLLCEAAGITGEAIMFSSNDTPAEDFVKAKELGAIINLDDVTHIEFLEKTAGLPELISLRYNPGPLRGGNAIIGKPEEAKYGVTREQLFEAYKTLKDKGVRRFGLHTMVVSNDLNPNSFVETARMLFELAVEVHERLDIRLEFVNVGGGIGIPYRPDDEPVDLEFVGAGVEAVYKELIEPADLHPLGLSMENGRMVTGPFGFLVTTAIHEKHTYKDYVGVDACMANLMRPGMYGAYHHLTVLGKEHAPAETTVDVVGSLCENNDKFAIDRQLPRIESGDLLVVHDAGAHGHAMGFQYNGKLRSAELLLQEDGTVRQIRRAETLDDYFATLDYPGI